MPIKIIELLVFWSRFLLNTEVISFHGSDFETGELGDAFAHGQSRVLQHPSFDQVVRP